MKKVRRLSLSSTSTSICGISKPQHNDPEPDKDRKAVNIKVIGNSASTKPKLSAQEKTLKKKVRTTSTLGIAEPQHTDPEPDKVKEALNIKCDPEAEGPPSTSSLNPEKVGQVFEGVNCNKTVNGYYENDGAEMIDDSSAKGNDETNESLDQQIYDLGLDKSGRQYYSCSFCSYTSHHRGTLIRHVKSVHMKIQRGTEGNR